MTLESMGQTMFDSLRNDLTYRIDASEIEQPFVDDNSGNTDEEHEKYEIKIHVNRGENIVQMTASDVFADHLRHIREHVLEKKIDDGDPTAQGTNKYRLVVLTHPAFYSVEQKRATRRAAIRAGFPTDKLRMITEPEAAALLFCNSWQGIEGGPILVYDMGGGTFDLAIVEVVLWLLKNASCLPVPFSLSWWNYTEMSIGKIAVTRLNLNQNAVLLRFTPPQ